MCRSGASCGCGGSSSAPVGLMVAIVALAALVSAAAALISQLLLGALAAVLVAALGFTAYAVYRVRVLTRPVPARRRARQEHGLLVARRRPALGPPRSQSLAALPAAAQAHLHVHFHGVSPVDAAEVLAQLPAALPPPTWTPDHHPTARKDPQ